MPKNVKLETFMWFMTSRRAPGGSVGKSSEMVKLIQNLYFENVLYFGQNSNYRALDTQKTSKFGYLRGF